MSLELEQQALAKLRDEAIKKGQTDLTSIKLSDEQRNKIDAVSDAYARQADELRRVQEQQDRSEQAANEFYSTFKSSMSGAIRGAESLSDALSNILDKLSDMLLNAAFDALFKPTSGGVGGGSFGGVFDWIGGLFRKDGGPVHAATGGLIRGPGGPRTDSIPAMLSDGEYVINAKATKQNRALLERINKGQSLALAGGGFASLKVPTMPNLRGATSSSSGGSFTFAPVIDARGADVAAVARLEQVVAQQQAQFSGRVVETMRNAKKTRNWRGTDYTPPIFAPIGVVRPTPQPIVDFSAVADVAQDNNGNNRRCAILLGWDGDQEDVDLVMYEIRTAWDLSVIFAGRTERVSVGSMLVAPGMLLLPTKSYQIRARYATYAGNRPFEWSDWIPVTMFDIRLGPLDIYPIDIDQLNEDVQSNLKWIGDSFRYVQEELDRIGAEASEQESANYFDKQTLRREMSVTAQGLKASYTEAIEVAIGPGSAIVTRIESLEAVVTDPVTGLEATASAVDLLQAKVTTLDGVVTATANSVTALTATVGNFSATGLFRTTVEATPAGALARIGLSVAASGNGTTSQAAIFLDALTGGQSRAVLNADQIILTNGTNSEAPFAFIGGQATMMLARINEITAGIIRSPDNQVVFNLGNKTLIFSDNT